MASLYERYVEYGFFYSEWDTGEIDTTLIGQTFTIGATGKNENFILKSVKLYLEKAGTPSGDLTIEIRNINTGTGMPTDEILATGTIAFADITTAGWYSCTNFTGNTLLSASTKYAIILNHMPTLTIANYLNIYGDDTGYTGGEAVQSIDGGTNWTTAAGIDLEDFAFQIYGDYYSTVSSAYGNVIAKAGAGANTTSVSVANIANYVQLAGSVLNARTKKNWTDAYAALNEDVKYIVDEIISDLAAIKVINYDMSGYTSRLEAEGMKLTLMNEAEKYIAELKDVDVQKWIVAVT
jgi:hypothetical protein